MTRITELATEDEWRRARPVLMQLWSDVDRVTLDTETYLAELRELAENGYRLFGREAGGDIVAVVGIYRRRNVWWGEYVFVCDLVTAAEHRREGHAGALLSFVADWGRTRGCGRLVLSTAVERDGAQAFYEAFGFERTSYLYQYAVG